MADVRGLLLAELGDVERLLSRLPERPCSRLTELELAGVAALLHGFYNGIENTMKLVLRFRGAPLPEGPTWHRDLLNLALSQGLLSGETAQALRPYLAFRHFFSHGYAVELDPLRIEPLVSGARSVMDRFRADIRRSPESQGSP